MKRKFIVLLAFALLTAAVAGAEHLNAKQYVLTVEHVDPKQVKADGHTQVNIRIKVTRKDGTPCPDHDIYAYSMNGGGFKAYRVRTDESGVASFIYIPYKASALQEAGDVTLKFQDQSNSYIVRIPAKTSYVLTLLDYHEEQSGRKRDDIFD